MSRYSSEEQRWMLTVAQLIVGQIAPEEMQLCEIYAAGFFQAPPRIPTDRQSNAKLGNGYGGTDVPSTIAILLILDAVLTHAKETGTIAAAGDISLLDPQLWTPFLDSARREGLRQTVHRQARQHLLPVDAVAQTTEQVIAVVVEGRMDQPSPRVINAWLADHDPQVPLHVGATYVLCFDVAAPRSKALASIGGVDTVIAAVAPDQDVVDLTVLLIADGFSITSLNPQTIQVPRTGSSAPICFSIMPQQAGAQRITAIIMANNQPFQRLNIEVKVGHASARSNAVMHVQASGEIFDSFVQNQDLHPTLSLVIIGQGAGYQLLICGEVNQKAFINISDMEISWLSRQARAVLHKIFHSEQQNVRVYQRESIVIPEAQYQHDLQQLAQIGRMLFDKLFYARRGEDARAAGDLLSSLMRRQPFNIRIIADRFVFPWALLYVGAAHEPIDLRHFWGFHHLIGCVPFNQSQPVYFLPSIDIEQGEPIRIAFVYGMGLRHGGDEWRHLVERQAAYFSSLPGVEVTRYPRRADLLQLMNAEAPPPHIIYFYCHAMDFDSGNPAEVEQSYLTLTDGVVTLFDLDSQVSRRDVPTGQGPFVFLNACNSAVLSPHFYEGFVPCFIDRGARGVLGAETAISPYFAAEFAEQLIGQFVLGKETLGEIMLRLRQGFMHEHRNLFGLSYVLHSSSNLIIRRH